ncbi:MAG: hypothetical protein JSV62_14355 [Promethearchaeota archaeon]|nr:MAG: hypothetical protein JSV62_14355 [Candidatus Lokiarchaeota archaeon]
MNPGFIKKRRDKKEKDVKTEKSNSILLEKKTIIENGEKRIIEVTKEGKVVAKYEEIQEKPKIKTIVIEQDQDIDFSLSDLEDNGTLMVPLEIKEKIERFILKVLYEEKSVKSLKLLMDKVLEKANKEKITISEKPINMIIYQLNKEKKIQFTQTEGWKIRI